MSNSSALFQTFRPEPDELLRRIAQHIDDGMLEEIAAADYGYDIEEYFLPLRKIRDEGVVPSPMRWHPQEVLELVRWSEPDDPNWKPGSPRERGHWMRAFCCAVLLRAGGDPENLDLHDGWNSALIQLVDSLLVVGGKFNRTAAAFLAWLITKFVTDPEIEELGFFGVGLLWFGLNLGPDTSDEVIISLSEWIVSREQQEADDHGLHTSRYTYQWLLGTTFFDQRHSAWKSLGRRLMAFNVDDRSPAARDWVRLIGSQLAGEDR